MYKQLLQLQSSILRQTTSASGLSLGLKFNPKGLWDGFQIIFVVFFNTKKSFQILSGSFGLAQDSLRTKQAEILPNNRSIIQAEALAWDKT